MRRLVLLTGMAIGYVLGARAGTERYEQLRGAWKAFSRSAPAQQLSAQVGESASKAGHTLKAKATERFRQRSSNGSAAYSPGR